ncbi:MAG: NUDIX domain-containing protein [Gordonia amarae]
MTGKTPAAKSRGTVKRSAGILLFRGGSDDRGDSGELELLIVHPGGPLWARKDAGAWSIPKGLVEHSDGERAETDLDAARREFTEETGAPAPDGPYLELGEVRQSGGKTVVAFAARGDLDPAGIVSNTFEMPWPPRSGRTQSFPEIDRAEWMEPEKARAALNPAQAEFVTRLLAMLAGPGGV